MNVCGLPQHTVLRDSDSYEYLTGLSDQDSKGGLEDHEDLTGLLRHRKSLCRGLEDHEDLTDLLSHRKSLCRGLEDYEDLTGLFSHRNSLCRGLVVDYTPLFLRTSPHVVPFRAVS